MVLSALRREITIPTVSLLSPPPPPPPSVYPIPLITSPQGTRLHGRTLLLWSPTWITASSIKLKAKTSRRRTIARVLLEIRTLHLLPLAPLPPLKFFKSVPNNEAGCIAATGTWASEPAFGIPPPECKLAAFSRDNHLGNAGTGMPPVHTFHPRTKRLKKRRKTKNEERKKKKRKNKNMR